MTEITCRDCGQPIYDPETDKLLRCPCTGGTPFVEEEEPQPEPEYETMQVEIFRNREEQIWACRPVTGPYARRVAFSVTEAQLKNVHISVDSRQPPSNIVPLPSRNGSAVPAWSP